MRDERVILRAEQAGRSFEWLLSPELAAELGGRLRAKGWTVSIRPVDEDEQDSE
jgi:hypothetical protein